MVKREYNVLSISKVPVEMSGDILVGSLTSVPIKIGTVKVEEYEAGFDEEGQDFKEISFD